MQNRGRFSPFPIIAVSFLVASLGCTDEVTAPRSPDAADRPALSTTYVNGNVTMTDLGTVPGTTGNTAVGINDAGVIIGQARSTEPPCTVAAGCGIGVMWPSYTSAGESHGFLAFCSWPQHSAFRAINNVGTIVGDGSCGTSSWVGFARDPFGVTRAIPNGFSLADVNDAGVAVGTALFPGPRLGAAKWDLSGSSITLTDLTQSISGVTFHQAFAINSAGAIAGRALTTPGDMAAVLWPDGSSSLLGMLPGTVSSHAEDITDDGVVVGFSRLGPPTNFMLAFVWSAGQGMRAIGSLGPFNSRAMAINEDGIIVGTSNTPAGPTHAFAFKDGVMIDLGVLPGHTFSQAHGINESGEIVGSSFSNTGGDIRAVRWTVAFPSAPGTTPSGSDVVVTPNDENTGAPAPVELTFDDVAGEGTTTVTSGTVGSGSGGPPAPGGFRLGNPPTYYDVQTTAVFTGSVTLCFDYSGASYGNENNLKLLHYENGVWTDVTTSLDTANDTICGTVTSLSPFIVAEENAAPVVTSISLPGAPVPVGTSVSVTASFTDANPGDVHTATIGWDDGSTSAATVTELAGNGSVNATHSYLTPGVYTIDASVSDGDLTGTRSSTSDQPAYIVVYDPTDGFVTGGGWIDSPNGACLWSGCAPDGSTTGKASFGFVSRYKKGATVPTGNTEFQFKAASLTFRSTHYQWLVIAGARAQYKGEGQIAGDAATYGFLITAIDGALPGGGGTDRFRIKLWNVDTGEIVYDNQVGQLDDSDAATAIGGGSVVIHK